MSFSRLWLIFEVWSISSRLGRVTVLCGKIQSDDIRWSNYFLRLRFRSFGSVFCGDAWCIKISSDDSDVSGCWIAFGFAVCLSSVEFCQKAVTCSFRKVISAANLLSYSCSTWFDFVICICFFWGDWFVSCNALITCGWCVIISWSELIWDERSAWRSSIACFCSLIKLSYVAILSLILSRSPEVMIWNCVNSASN